MALLFAIAHLSIDQMLGALVVGLIAGLVVYRARSLWSGLLAHAGTNAVSAVLALLVALAAPGATEAALLSGDLLGLVWIGALVWGGIALVALVPIFFLLRGIGRRYPAPAHPEARLDFQILWSFALVLVGGVGYMLYDLLR